MQMKTSDGALVTVLFPSIDSKGAYDMPFVEVVGTVLDQRTVQEETHLNVKNIGNYQLQFCRTLLYVSSYVNMCLLSPVLVSSLSSCRPRPV